MPKTALRVSCSLIAGLLFGCCRSANVVLASHSLAGQVGENVVISGAVCSIPKQKGRQQSFTLCSSNTLIYASVASSRTFTFGDQIAIEGQLRDGFGAYAASLSQATIVQLSHEDSWLNRARSGFLLRLEAAMPAPESTLAASYILGRSDLLPETLAEEIRGVGLAHIVAVSGFHLGVILGLSRKIFGKISRFSAL